MMKKNHKIVRSVCKAVSGLLLLSFLLAAVIGLSGCEEAFVSDVASIFSDILTEAETTEGETASFRTETAEENAPATTPPQVTEPAAQTEAAEPQKTPDENGRYSTPEEVALYLHPYGKLPKNFITKKAAQDLGWDSGKGNLWDVTDQMSIGGDSFGNREGLLPSQKGRQWYECDVNYNGGFRGGERIVYSNDGLIYYTADHYESFTRLY